MKSTRLPTITPAAPILEGLRIIDEGALEAALVVEGGGLVGFLTDGDVRRAILRGLTLQAPVGEAMKREFTSVGPEIDRAAVLDIMKARQFKQVPVVGANGNLLGVHLLHELLGNEERPNAALILCGGLGTRLRPITKTLPKPMIPVAGRPILERIILHLVGYGIRRVFLATHYMGEVIEGYFGDGSKFGCTISYIREEKPLGTGGALAFLPPDVMDPTLIMNGDIVSQFNAGRLLDAHASSANRATIGVHNYVHEVPFGVLDIDGDRVVGLREKPALSLLVNAGIYVVDAEVRRHLVPGEAVTVPAILENCLNRGERVGYAEVGDDWMDVGRPDELNRARGLG